jgi:hypothetical protein
MHRLRRFLPVVLIALLAAACAAPDNGRVQAADPTAAATASATPAIPDTAGPAASAVPAATAAPATPSAAPPSATPAPTADAPAAARLEPFAMNLFREGDFVPQYTFEWCVGASLQMMRNLTDAKVTRARSTQQTYWELARDLSSSPFGGANPRGWTAALNELGVGPYELVSIPEYDDALRAAAKALRVTDRPVGLVMWSGRHAWVMSGFTAKGDPARDDGFRVTGIRVLDPLHPHGNARWGASPEPNSLVTPARLARQFVIRDRFRVNLGVPPGYLLILPVETTGAG